MIETTAMQSTIGLDAVRFDEDGRAQLRDPDQPLKFQFRYRGMPFHAQIDFKSKEAARLRLTGILGAVPYTIESAYLRQTVFSLIELANDTVPDRIKLTETHRVAIIDEVSLEKPTTPVDAVEAITQMITKSRPLILFFQTVLSAPRMPNH